VLLRVAENSDDPVPSLVAFLEDKQMLIVLDSCEHMIEAAAVFSEQLLRGASVSTCSRPAANHYVRPARWSSDCRRLRLFPWWTLSLLPRLSSTQQ
jgi:hypothetical protein